MISPRLSRAFQKYNNRCQTINDLNQCKCLKSLNRQFLRVWSYSRPKDKGLARRWIYSIGTYQSMKNTQPTRSNWLVTLRSKLRRNASASNHCATHYKFIVIQLPRSIRNCTKKVTNSPKAIKSSVPIPWSTLGRNWRAALMRWYFWENQWEMSSTDWEISFKPTQERILSNCSQIIGRLYPRRRRNISRKKKSSTESKRNSTRGSTRW